MDKNDIALEEAVFKSLLQPHDWDYEGVKYYWNPRYRCRRCGVHSNDKKHLASQFVTGWGLKSCAEYIRDAEEVRRRLGR